MHIISKMEKRFGGQSQTIILVQGIVLVLIIGCVDYLTGYYLSFSIFYLIPITFVTWFSLRNYGIAVSLLSAIAWLAADIFTEHYYPHPLIPFWNAALRLGFFLIVTLLLSKLKEVLERERKLARQDHLTKTYNSRAFYELAKLEIDRSRRYNHPLTLVYLDLDNFKTVNDRYGHQAGDTLLATVGDLLRQNMRTSDIAARMGGDEFALLLAESSSEAARQLITRIQAELLAAMHRNGWPVTFSIGMITWRRPSKKVEDMIRAADHLMYEVKNNGKNEIKHLVFEREQWQ